jgi:hypothetical protein
MRHIFTITLVLGFSLMLYAQEWQQIGNFNRAPTCLFNDTIDNILYVGGDFKFNGTDTLNGISYFDGITFHPMQQGRSRDCGNVNCGYLSLITRYRNEIYIGAVGKELSGVPVRGGAKWNGSSWSTIGNPGLFYSPYTTPDLLGSFEKDSILYCVGIFLSADGDTCNSVASWDGTQWKGLAFLPDPGWGSPLLKRIAFYKDQWYVTGNNHTILDGVYNDDIARYDGTAWQSVGGGMIGGDSFIEDMVVYKDELYICGHFAKNAGNKGNKIMRWDGNQWKDVGGGLCSPYDIATDMMVYQDKLYVVGIFNCVGNGLPASDIAVWDGEKWCSFGNSIFDNKLNCTETYKDEIYVGGGFTIINGQPSRFFAKYIGDHSTDTCQTVISGVAELEARPILGITPNPAQNYLNLQLQDSSPPIESIEILDAAGRNCSQFIDWKTTDYTTGQLHIQRLPAGWYCVRVRCADRVLVGRFVKG